MSQIHISSARYRKGGEGGEGGEERGRECVKNYKLAREEGEHAKNYELGVAMKKRTIGVTEKGIRVGEDHQRAKLSDADVETMRRLYEEGVFGYRAIARAFGCSRNTVKSIVKYERRNATPMAYRSVEKRAGIDDFGAPLLDRDFDEL